MPQLRDRLTENRKNAKINKELPLNEGNTKQMQQIAKEEALILRQIKVLENDIIAKENIIMNKEYKKAAGIVNG